MVMSFFRKPEEGGLEHIDEVLALFEEGWDEEEIETKLREAVLEGAERH